MKALTAIKVIFYIVVIIGIAFYALDLYTSRASWSASLAKAPEFSFEAPTSINIHLQLKIFNPSHSKVMIRNLWYSIYINDYFVGEGFKPYLILKPGNNTVIMDVRFDISNIPCPLAKAFYNGEKVKVNVSGYAVADLMLFGRYSFRSVVIPFNVVAKEVSVPTLPKAARSVLYVYIYYCDHSGDIIKALSKVSSLTNILG